MMNSIDSLDLIVVSTNTTILVDAAKRGNFEEAADFLLLADPPRRMEQKDNHNVYIVTGGGSEDEGKGVKKVEKGSTGVEPSRYYAKSKFKKLSQDQRE